MSAEQHRRDLQVALGALCTIERRIQARMDLCFHADEEAERAVRQAFLDVRDPIHQALDAMPTRGITNVNS